jgi:uncharacterized cupin superfamily protein
MMVDSVIKLAVRQANLNPSPIYPAWILEGNPVARNTVLSSSADGTASTLIWDCTAGRFNWIYDVDETIYVIEGGVVIKDPAGKACRLGAGDTIFFPAGARAEWHVEDYIRKIAFCRTPLPGPLVFAKRGFRYIKRRVFGRTSTNSGPAMFQKS